MDTWIRSNLDFSVRMLFDMKPKINLNPPYQRGLAWDIGVKQHLIWCILADQDIPKLQFHLRPDGNGWDVVDGKQRLTAIWAYAENKFPLATNAEMIDRHSVSNLFLRDLHDELRLRFYSYVIQVTQIDSNNPKRVVNQFLDLQRGVRLNGQEKRQARPGFVRDLVVELAAHPFIALAHVNYKRGKKNEIVSRLLAWELADNIVETVPEDLDEMYLSYANDTLKNGQWRAIKTRMTHTFDQLYAVFGQPHVGLRTVVTFMLTYWLWRNLQRHCVITDDLRANFPAWFDNFTAHIKSGRNDTKAPLLLQGWPGASSAASLNRDRYEYMMHMFFFAFPQVPRKDPNRHFSNDQRLEIWNQNEGLCQWVDENQLVCGVWLPYDSFDADHIIPHSMGGPTTTENGRVMCPYRNRGGHSGECPHRQAN